MLGTELDGSGVSLCGLSPGAPSSGCFDHMRDPAVELDHPAHPREAGEWASWNAALSSGESVIGADLGILNRDAYVSILVPEGVRYVLYADTNHLTLEDTEPAESHFFTLLAPELHGG
jgi:hypothetical protein